MIERPKQLVYSKHWLLLISVLMILLSSCSVDKRLHRPGYHLDWVKSKHAPREYVPTAERRDLIVRMNPVKTIPTIVSKASDQRIAHRDYRIPKPVMEANRPTVGKRPALKLRSHHIKTHGNTTSSPADEPEEKPKRKATVLGVLATIFYWMAPVDAGISLPFAFFFHTWDLLRRRKADPQYELRTLETVTLAVGIVGTITALLGSALLALISILLMLPILSIFFAFFLLLAVISFTNLVKANRIKNPKK